MVLTLEVGGRWSAEAWAFVRGLARARAREEPQLLRRRAQAAWHRRLVAILAVAAPSAFGESFLERDCARGADGELPTTQAVLEEAGFSFEHLVSATVYLTDINTLDIFDAVWQEYFPDPMAYPSRAVVEVAALVLGIQLEISAIAIKD